VHTKNIFGENRLHSLHKIKTRQIESTPRTINFIRDQQETLMISSAVLRSLSAITIV
jgi:hypothetical protein